MARKGSSRLRPLSCVRISDVDSSEIRAWGEKHGWELADFGRLPDELKSEFLYVKNTYGARQPKRLATMRQRGLIA